MTENDARSALTERIAALDAQDRMSDEARAPVTLQQDSVGRLSRMDAMQQQAMALAAQRRRQAERNRLYAAIERLDAGEWGYCLSCGDDIAPLRLAHDPAATQCIACAAGEKG